MRTTSWALAAVLALATTALAEPERPRIYYPRHVKRQFVNATSTITSSESLPPPETTASITQIDTTTTKRQSLGDLLSGLLPGDGDDEETSTSATKKTTTSTKTASDASASDASDSGILVGPTGIVTTSDAEPTTTTKGGLLDPILTNLLPDPETTTTAVSSDPEDTTTKKGTATTKDEATTKVTTKEPEPTTTTKGGLLDPILTGLLPDPTTTNSTAPETTTVPTKTETEPSVETTTTKGGILPTLLPPPESTTTSAETESPPNTTVPEVPTSAPTTTAPTSLPTDISISSEIPVTNTTAPEEPPLTQTTVSSLPTSEPTDVPVTNITTAVEPTTAPTELPTTEPAETTAPTTTAPASETELPEPTSVPDTSAPATSVPAETADPVTSIHATATYTNTADWLPSTMVGEPTTMTWQPPTGVPTATSKKGLPTDIPKYILPDNPDEPAPKGSIPIQIGFKYPLNYVWVAKNTMAAAQIFEYLPRGLAEAGGFDIDQIQIVKLVPWDTQDKWNYVTTIVKLYYPETMIEKLQTHMSARNSPLYNHHSDIVTDIMRNINTKVDIFGDDESGGSYGETPGGNGGKGGGNNNNDAFDNGGDSGSSKQMGMTAGIAMGALGLSVMYGAAMFIVARRYKRKRQARHQRASSMGGSEASSDMQFTGQGSPALMGGALLSRDMSSYGGMAGGRESHGSRGSGGNNSARTANISAPVAAENSLGWN